MDAASRLIIGTLCLSGFAIGTDFTGVILLVTDIQKDFGVDITTSQWVLNIYALTFSMLMVTGGRLGDMYGRRRLALIGVFLFAVASLICMLSPSIGVLIAGRALQGVGAGFLWPCLLALGGTLFGEEKSKVAMGMVFASITFGNVLGPLIGGVAVSAGDWRLFFLANLVLLAAAMVLTFMVVPKDTVAKTDERVDYAGMAILSGAVLALLYALDVGADLGWLSLPILGLFALSVVLFGAFPVVENRVKDPMLLPAMMKNRQFVLTLWTNALQIPALFIAFLYFPQFMQNVLGWSTLQASFGMLPVMILLAIVSSGIGHLYNRFGLKRLLLLGFVSVTLSTLLIVLLQPEWGYFAIFPAMVLLGFGAALSVGSAGLAAVSAVQPERAGVAGGLTFMLHLSYGAIGVALATAIMNSFTQGPSAASFATGMSYAYAVPLVSAFIGIFVVLAIDESKLRSVDQ